MTTAPLPHDTYMVIYRDRTGAMWCNETFFPGETFEKFVSDLYGGEHDTAAIDRIVCINIDAGTATDCTRKCAQAVADLSFHKDFDPDESARDLCERFGFELFDRAAAYREFTSYQEQIESDYRSMQGYGR